MSTRTAITVVGGVIGAYFGYPQLGFALGALVGSAVDPQTIQGPKINEITVQTSQEGAPRTIVHGTVDVVGNVIQIGPLVKVTTSESQGKGGGPEVETERAYRSFAIRVCEGTIEGYLRVWADNKLVYDVRSGSGMAEESAKWAEGVTFYYGDESQLPDPTLVALNADAPAHRGTAYIVFTLQDVTARQGSISQYRFEVASTISAPIVGEITNTTSINPARPGPGIYARADGKLATATHTAAQASVPSGSYDTYVFNNDLSIYASGATSINGAWNGDSYTTPTFVGLQGIGDNGFAIFQNNSSFGGCWLASNGAQIGALKPDASALDYWWSSPGAVPANDGRRTWFSPTHLYLGTVARNSVNVNKIFLFSLSGGFPQYASATISGVCTTPGGEFFMHLGNDGKLRVIADDSAMRTYSGDTLTLEDTAALPFSLASIHGFGVDRGLAAFVFRTSSRLEIRKISDWSLVKTISDSIFFDNTGTRVVFTDDSLYVQCITSSVQNIARIEYNTFTPDATTLGAIVADCHDRLSFPVGKYDVTELTDPVAGAGFAGDYTAADCINTLRPPYYFDKSDRGGLLYYQKRGAAVVESISIDDLVEIPDTTRREQAIEVPKKLHMFYKHAASGYARVKATAASSSPDLKTTGEASLEVPAVMGEDEAAQRADIMYKITRAEVNGTSELVVPLRKIKYTPGDCIGVSLRGMVRRQRIEQMDYADGQIKLTLKDDRQSAYTSNLTGVPIPEPTLPPSTIVGETVMAILDISARVDSEDDLSYLVAVSGARPAWYGARYQRSLDAGANYTTVEDISTASIIGTLLADVPSASESYTDTTNSVSVLLYRDSQTLESITSTEFLSEGGAFALQKADGSWEVMQYLDAVEESGGSFTLTTLHRGLLNSGAAAHTAGALFVLLARPTHIPAQAAWIGQDLTHRAISFGETADDTTNDMTDTFVGRSQIEWPVASLAVERDVSDVITGTWAPRHRFGTDDAPVASINFQGYRVTLDDGVLPAVTFDTLTAGFTYDASALGTPLDVSVSSLNRITGAGPATSESI